MSIAKIRVDTREVEEYLRNTIQNLQDLPTVCRDNLLRGMTLAQGLAQIYTPVETGRLRDSIHLEMDGEGVALVADAQNEYGQYYGVYPEYGIGQPAQPYLRPAVSQGIQEIITSLGTDIKDMFRRDYFMRRGRLFTAIRSIETGQFVGGGYV
jgi:hypothetical protein